MEKKDSDQAPNEKTYIVKYRLPGEEGRNPRKVRVSARNQSDAKKTALATIPDAKIIGGPKEIKESIEELDEGVLDFARRVGNFLKRCVGHGCLKYADSPIKGKKDTISTTRKMLTRELAQHAGEKLVRSGGGEPRRVKIKMAKKKKKKPSIFGAIGSLIKNKKSRTYKKKKR
jgi:hypothetical protein